VVAAPVALPFYKRLADQAPELSIEFGKFDKEAPVAQLFVDDECVNRALLGIVQNPYFQNA
jgi:hypothetical protein